MPKVTSQLRLRPISRGDTCGRTGFTGLKLSIGLGAVEPVPGDRTRETGAPEEVLGDPEGRGIRLPNL